MTTATPTVDYVRQAAWFDPTKTFASVTVVGCGGIGSFAAFALAKLGVQRLALVDFDIVEEHNIPNQLYGLEQSGSFKTEALVATLMDYSGISDVDTSVADLAEGIPLNEVVVSALDSMAARADLWQQVKYKAKCKLFLDARLGGEHVVLYALNPSLPADVKGYEATLHSDDEGMELPCTARSVIDVGFSVGALIARATRVFYSRGELPSVTYLDQQNLDIYKSGWPE